MELGWGKRRRKIGEHVCKPANTADVDYMYKHKHVHIFVEIANERCEYNIKERRGALNNAGHKKSPKDEVRKLEAEQGG